jgi:hypothetical protein
VWARGGEPGAFPTEKLDGVRFKHSPERSIRQLGYGREGDSAFFVQRHHHGPKHSLTPDWHLILPKHFLHSRCIDISDWRSRLRISAIVSTYAWSSSPRDVSGPPC